MKKRKPGREPGRDDKGFLQGSENEHTHSPAANPILNLQRTAGNRAVQKMLGVAPTKPGLRVSQPGEPEEVEAERISRRVAGVSDAEAGMAPRQADDVASPDRDSSVNLGPGRPLDASLRKDMEAHLGHDLSGVRIHADAQAAQSARSLDARAYTVGKDVVFAGGEYAPEKKEGKRLLAHELTHVIQQGASRPVAPGTKTAATPQAQSSGKVQRQPKPDPKSTGTGTQPAQPPQLTQDLYDKAIAILAKMSGVNPALLAILQQGKVGKTAPGVKQIKVAATATDPGAQLTFDLEIAGTTAGLPQGAAAQFVNEPATQVNITSDPAKGMTLATRLLKIIAKPTASADDMALSLFHEGIHMLLEIDRMVDQFSGIFPGLASGTTGTMRSFSQYQNAGKSSKKRAALVSAMVAEVNRVNGPSAPPPPTPAPSSKPPANPPPTTAPAATPSANDVVDKVIDEILEERFAFDQQLKQFPTSKPATNTALADAYMFDELASELSLKSWPAPPNRQALVTLMAAFLDDVELTVNPPAPAKPAPSAPPPKKQ